MQEVWKSVVGYEQEYQISNKGNVKRKAHWGNYETRNQYKSYKQGMFYKERPIKFRDNGHGYMCITVKNKTLYVHILVATAFISNPLNKPQVNHIDSNRSNNNLSNLEWVTVEENTLHAMRYGNVNSPTKQQIEKMIKMYKSGMSMRTIGKQLGFGHSTVKRKLLDNNIKLRGNTELNSLKYQNRVNGNIKNILYDYSIGNSKEIIATKYHISYSSVTNILKDNNVKLRTTWETRKLK